MGDKEGMLVEDFDRLGAMNTYYNYAYYPQHMEALGNEKEVDWVQVRIQIPSEIPTKYARVARLSFTSFRPKTTHYHYRGCQQHRQPLDEFTPSRSKPKKLPFH